MKVLVTGSNGFIGKALCHRIAADGYSLVSGVRANIENTTDVVSYGDITGNTNWSDALRSCESVVHLAGRAHVLRDTESDPLAKYRTVNADGTLNLARQAAEAGVQRFVFISSIGVNGAESFQTPFTEKDIPSPCSHYAISKYETELGLLAIAKKTSMEIVTIRPPLVYGPGAPGNFSSLVRWLTRGIPLPLGGFNNRRSLVALDNLVDLIVTCLRHPAAANQIFLVSDDEDLSTADLLQRIGAALGRPVRLLHVHPVLLHWGARLLGKDDMAQRLLGNLQVDITKAKNLLDWNPPLNVDEGLRKAAEWYLAKR